MDETPETKICVTQKLHEDFEYYQAKAIVAEVYQPLLDEIKRLEKRVEALEKESFRQSLYINDDQ